MEQVFEKEPGFEIEKPKLGDELALAPMHIKSWKETYVNSETGLTEEMVDDLLGHMLKDTSYRRNTIIQSIEDPNNVLYRVVKNNKSEIVGFMHGSKQEDCNKLQAIYLLGEAQGVGVGDKLMEEFLAWIETDKPTYLEVFSNNFRAIDFYIKYGFKITDKPVQMWKKLPVIEMLRPADLSDKAA